MLTLTSITIAITNLTIPSDPPVLLLNMSFFNLMLVIDHGDAGDDTDFQMYLQFIYVSIGDNYGDVDDIVGDDTNDDGDDVEIRKACRGLKGCKDVNGNLHKPGDSYIGDSTTI